MFSDARTNYWVADLTELDTVNLLYADRQWSEVPTILTLVFDLSTAVSGKLVATKIASYLTGVYSKVRVKANFLGDQLTVAFSETTEPSSGVRSAPVTRDMLVTFTSQALSALGVDFVKLSAS